MGWGGVGTVELAGLSISVSACRDLSQCGGLSSWRQSRLLPAEAGMPGGGQISTFQHNSNVVNTNNVLSITFVSCKPNFKKKQLNFYLLT